MDFVVNILPRNAKNSSVAEKWSSKITAIELERQMHFNFPTGADYANELQCMIENGSPAGRRTAG